MYSKKKPEEIELLPLSSQNITKKDNPSLSEPHSTLAEEDCSSLWQYAVHETNNVSDWVETFLPILVSLFFFTTFYCLIDYLTLTPPPSQIVSNYTLFLLAKYFFTAFMIIQAECECFDGWRMFTFAQGHQKRINFFGSMQYVSGTFVGIVSYSLINRSSTILNILSNSACLTVFLRIDDVVLAFLNKFFPENKKKVIYDKGSFEKDDKTFVMKTLAIKLGYFVFAEFMNEVFMVRIFI